MESVISILELATSAKSLWMRKSTQNRKGFLNRLLRNSILDGVHVRYELKKPFVVIVKKSDNPERKSGALGRT